MMVGSQALLRAMLENSWRAAAVAPQMTQGPKTMPKNTLQQAACQSLAILYDFPRIPKRQSPNQYFSRLWPSVTHAESLTVLIGATPTQTSPIQPLTKIVEDNVLGERGLNIPVERLHIDSRRILGYGKRNTARTLTTRKKSKTPTTFRSQKRLAMIDEIIPALQGVTDLRPHLFTLEILTAALIVQGPRMKGDLTLFLRTPLIVPWPLKKRSDHSTRPGKLKRS
jgi:hypothetical protein